MIPGDTIAAVSSATGPALRMILRLSGPQAVEWASSLSADPLPRPGGAGRVGLAFRKLQVPAWIYCFKAPRSYTGEDLVELHIPGSPLLAQLLLEDLLNRGARSAEPGEFTARAYFNGRLDLAEAEGVAATVSAGNEAELSAARRLMSGELSRRLAPVIELIANTLALLEVGIDFSEEDVAVISEEETAARLTQAQTHLRQLIEESARFEPLTHEPNIVLVGRPNAGKSTLLNALVGHERAVVSPIAGTTRDVLSAELFLQRGMIRLTDVAGLEEYVSPIPHSNEQGRIESQMREAALRAVEEADSVILVQDATDERQSLKLPRKPELVVLSKMDLLAAGKGAGTEKENSSILVGSALPTDTPTPATTVRSADPTRAHKKSSNSASPSVQVSAKSGIGLDTLRHALDALCFGENSATPTLALNARHRQAIHNAQSALQLRKRAESSGRGDRRNGPSRSPARPGTNQGTDVARRSARPDFRGILHREINRQRKYFFATDEGRMDTDKKC